MNWNDLFQSSNSEVPCKHIPGNIYHKHIPGKVIKCFTGFRDLHMRRLTYQRSRKRW